MAALLCKETFLDYQPIHVTAVPSWSGDKNYILKLHNNETIFMRSFLGKSAQVRCAHFQSVLHALQDLAEAPKLLRSDDTHVAVTVVPGQRLVYGDLHDVRKLQSVMHAMGRFYDALVRIKHHLPQSKLWVFKRHQFSRHVRDQEVSADLKPLLDFWESQFLPKLCEMDVGVVHGDLHINNILMDGDCARILDFDECQQGSIVEDLMKLSVCHGLKSDGDQMLLQRWFPGDREAARLFEACKVLERFSWAVGCIIPKLSMEEVRSAVFAQNPPPIDLSWVPRVCAHNLALPDSGLEFLSASVRDLRILCESE